MSDDVVTLALEGDVSLADFARATQAFDHLLRSLTRTVTPHSDLEWFVEHLDSGSAVMTARPEGTDLGQAESVSEAYRAVGRSLSEHEPILPVHGFLGHLIGAGCPCGGGIHDRLSGGNERA